MNTPATSVSFWHSPRVIITAACLIAIIGFGIRSVFGLFVEPMTIAKGWNRETIGLAFAIQNLMWGLGLPIAGAICDKFGPVRVIGGGAIPIAGVPVANDYLYIVNGAGDSPEDFAAGKFLLTLYGYDA